MNEFIKIENFTRCVLSTIENHLETIFYYVKVDCQNQMRMYQKFSVNLPIPTFYTKPLSPFTCLSVLHLNHMAILALFMWKSYVCEETCKCLCGSMQTRVLRVPAGCRGTERRQCAHLSNLNSALFDPICQTN